MGISSAAWIAAEGTVTDRRRYSTPGIHESALRWAEPGRKSTFPLQSE
jgi:hypothetical protein